MTPKMKNLLKKELLDKGEEILEKRRQRLYQNNLGVLKVHANPKLDYQKKINFIEGSIEKDIQFFGTDY